MIDVKEFFSNENCIRAKAHCEGKDISLDTQRFFMEFYKEFKGFVSRKYKIDDESNKIIESQNKNKTFPNKIMIRTSSPFSDSNEPTEVSVGDFLLNSLKSWNPDKASYLTYINNLLLEYGNAVPAARTVAQEKNKYLLDKFYEVVRSMVPQEEITAENFQQILDTYLPDEYSEKKALLYSIYASPLSFDKALNENSDSDSLFTIENEASLEKSKTSNEAAENKLIDEEELWSLFDRVYDSFSGLQERVKARLSLYLTIELMKATTNKLSIDDFKKLERTQKYENMIVHVDWIEKFIKDKFDEKDNTDDLFPSQIDQAQFLGIDYNSYCNSISAYKKKSYETIKGKD